MIARKPARSRRGTFVPILAVCLVAMFAFLAMAIDLGMLAVTRTQCQNAADAAALTGARILNNKPTATNNDYALARSTASATMNQNKYLTNNFATTASNLVVGVYDYNTTSERFVPDLSYSGAAPPTGKSWSAVRATISGISQNSYFAKVRGSAGGPVGAGWGGVSTLTTGASAVAVHRPRDIAIVLDFSGSMGYDTTLGWGTTNGFLNPDPSVPKFGHYAAYQFYRSNAVGTTTSGTVGNRSNPLWNTGASGDRPPANFTMETQGGPPMVESFYTYPNDPAFNSGVTTATPGMTDAFKMWSPTLVTPVNTTTLAPAKYVWTAYPPAAATPDMTRATPAPANYEDQSDSPVAYIGDKWPRNNGARGPDTSVTINDDDFPTTYSNSNTPPNPGRWANSYTSNKGCDSLRQFLNNPNLNASGATDSGPGRNISGWTMPTATGYTAPSTTRRDGGETNANFRDSVWEAYGYDLNVKKLYYDDAAASGTTETVELLPQAERFKGYSMGPGYWGKTFFIWPPDPRWGGGTGTPNPASVQLTGNFAGVKDTNGNWICDWRRRFFLNGDGTPFDPETQNINQILFRGNAKGHVLNDVTTTGTAAASTAGYYRINYNAVIAWLKAGNDDGTTQWGPKVLPTNLRSGRICYYDQMPNDITGNDDNSRYFRHYIHYVLGVGQTGDSNLGTTWGYTAAGGFLAGVESNYNLGSLSDGEVASNPQAMGATTNYTPTSGTPANEPNPRPYMDYSHTINRPRAHFWFGPQSMVLFMERQGEDRPWWAGTTREAQCWQLKAAINSVLDDIRNNHPNDYCGMSYFAARSHFYLPMAPMSQDWFTLKNTLFFRKDTVTTLKATPASPIEHRPYSGAGLGNDTTQIPNGSGSTDPATGMAVAFNLLSSGTSAPLNNARYGNVANNERGRRGASKIVIFETDGVPNTSVGWTLTGTGTDTRYTQSGTTSVLNIDGSLNDEAKRAIGIASRVVAPVSTSGTSGYSLPNAPARVYSIGFGYLFNGWPSVGGMSSGGQTAHRFLLRMQQVDGNGVITNGWTSPPGDPPTIKLPEDQIITGPYQRPDPTQPVSASNPAGRIEKLRTCLERIFQSGVQVTLIE